MAHAAIDVGVDHVDPGIDGLWDEAQNQPSPTHREACFTTLFGLFRGLPFPYLPTHPQLVAIQQRCLERWLAACLWLCRRHEAHGQAESWLRLAEDALAIDPLNECLHREKVKALLALGRHPSAVQHVKSIVQRRSGPDDVGITPETLAYFESLIGPIDEP